MMTAEAVDATTGAGIDVLPSLRERNFGEHRGTAFDDLPVDVFAPDYQPPGGESWEAFHVRVDRAGKEDDPGPEPIRPRSPLLMCEEPTYEGVVKRLELEWPAWGCFLARGGGFYQAMP